jgi:hypothetical protein
MSSSRRPLRSRYRFGFRGKRPTRNAQAATTDEILDSLTRQARLMEKGEEEQTLGLQTILEVETEEELLHSLSLPEYSPKVTRLKTWSFGKLAFGIMLIGGLTFLSIYSRLSWGLNPQSLVTIQQTLSRVGFGDWQKIALMAICAVVIAVVIALFARRSTIRTRSRPLSTA